MPSGERNGSVRFRTFLPEEDLRTSDRTVRRRPFLDDLLCEQRGGGDVPGCKWVSTFDDALDWYAPVPLSYDRGSLFYSPSTGSRLIRYSHDGKLHWIGNITVENPKTEQPTPPARSEVLPMSP